MLERVLMAAVIIVAATASAAGQTSIGEQNRQREAARIIQEIRELDRQFREDRARTQRDRIADLDKLLSELRDALRMPCSSERVVDARNQAEAAVFVAKVYLKLDSDLEAVFAAAGRWMDVADVLRLKGCADDARRMYEEVFRRYPEMTYGGLRDRARLALDAMR